MGLAPGVVWTLTPREWCRELVAWQERQVAARNSEIRVAWMTALYQRVKKLPELDSQLQGDHKKKPQSKASMRGVLHMLSEMHGGRVTRGRAKKATPARVSRGTTTKGARRG